LILGPKYIMAKVTSVAGKIGSILFDKLNDNSQKRAQRMRSRRNVIEMEYAVQVTQ